MTSIFQTSILIIADILKNGSNIFDFSKKFAFPGQFADALSGGVKPLVVFFYKQIEEKDNDL